MTGQKSYQLIVLRDGNADHMGKGLTEYVVSRGNIYQIVRLENK